MAVTPVTLTITPTTHVTTSTTSKVRVTVWNNTEGAIIDADTDEILVGNYAKVITAGSTLAIELAPTDDATNPTNFQYQVSVHYVDQELRKRAFWYSGWFSLTEDANLADIAAEQYVPPTYLSEAIATLDAIADEAQGYADDAAASAAEATAIVIADADAAMAAAINTPGSDTETALAESFVQMGTQADFDAYYAGLAAGTPFVWNLTESGVGLVDILSGVK